MQAEHQEILAMVEKYKTYFDLWDADVAIGLTGKNIFYVLEDQEVNLFASFRTAEELEKLILGTIARELGGRDQADRGTSEGCGWDPGGSFPPKRERPIGRSLPFFHSVKPPLIPAPEQPPSPHHPCGDRSSQSWCSRPCGPHTWGRTRQRALPQGLPSFCPSACWR